MTDKLPEIIADVIHEAQESDTTGIEKDLREQELEVEKLRIKTDERINDRNAERDENIIESQLGVSEYRSMLDSLLSRVDSLLATINPAPQQSVEIEVPPVAHEDIPESEISNPIPEAVEEPEEEVEELAEDTNAELEKTESEIIPHESEPESNSIRKRGRKRRGRR